MNQWPELMTNQQAADKLGVSRTRFYELVKQGHIKRVRLPGSTRTHISKAELERFIKSLEDECS